MSSVVRLGLIGTGIQKSAAPALHMREAAAHGISCTYELIDLEVRDEGVSALPALLSKAEAQGFRGLNITHPCKQAVIAYLNNLSPEARALNAVNTVIFDSGERIGCNTDWSGFAEAYRRNLRDAAKASVVQMGAGGGGSAVAYALLSLGVSRLTIFDLDNDRAAALCANMKTYFPSTEILSGKDLAAAFRSADGMVNATPMGMAKYPGFAVPAAFLRPNLWVADIVYFPLETELLRTARRTGCRTMSGADMAVFQAVDAFRLFHNVEANAERMLRYFLEIVS